MITLIYPILKGMALFILSGYVLSRILKRNDIADPLWALGFLFIAFFSLPTTLTLKAKVVLVLLILWAVRLSGYLGLRFFKHQNEDKRYATWRNDWGPKEPLNAFLKVFVLQGLLLGVISTPLVFILSRPENHINGFDFLGASLFVIGFLFESISDTELYFFKKSNPGKLYQKGLWQLSRHPNYFGEILIWWGFGCFALSLSRGWITLISPALLTYLILKISGVPLLEKSMKSVNQNKYQDYAQITRTFFPFGKNELIRFGFATICILFLDFLWLDLLLKDFYFNQALTFARTEDGMSFAPMVWAGVWVYLLIPLGVTLFASSETQSPLLATYRGGMLGLVLYGVYDLTNLTLLHAWPIEMSLIDMLWGPTICGLSAGLSHKLTQLVTRQ